MRKFLIRAALSILALAVAAALGQALLRTSFEGASAAAEKPASLAVGSISNFTLFVQPKPVPRAQFKDAAGRAIDLTAFRGKVVLVNLWATWCLPCRLEMGSLDRLQAELGGADFAVVAISLDREGPGAVERFFKEIGIKNLALYIDDTTKAGREFGARGLPVSFLLNREGMEVGRLIGPAEWDTKEAVTLMRNFMGKSAGGA